MTFDLRVRSNVFLKNTFEGNKNLKNVTRCILERTFSTRT